MEGVAVPPVDLRESPRLRGYQYEMYERSLGRNVIVAMDTGSGKTHVALLRIQREIDLNPGKLVWFLAPTVALSEQQAASIAKHLPAIRIKVLTGSDNVDRWSEQKIWDAALTNRQVVVSTFAVLRDALAHGFVDISTLSLLIFDEAHHCNRGHPANKIMKDFYHPRKSESGPSSVPHILGLTASPILRSKISELSIIEGNLDAISITPRIHRQELLRHVHRPTLHRLEYKRMDQNSMFLSSEILIRLKRICEDKAGLGPIIFTPEPKPGRWQQGRPKSQDKVQEQMLRFFAKTMHLCEELGPWAADVFVLESISALRAHVHGVNGMVTQITDSRQLLSLLTDEYLSGQSVRDFNASTCLTSPKVDKLIAFLTRQDPTECSGIVFVQQRVTTSILRTLLSAHPLTKSRFKCATFVGMANSGSKKYSMSELLDLKAQRETLNDFRMRRKDLIISTDALEEGIDVSACNLVVCFSPPPNLKSFVQRRGRARQEKSQFAVMFPDDCNGDRLKYWRSLEEDLIKAYQSDLREAQKAQSTEEEEEEVIGELRSSIAFLTPTDAMAHLYHFCNCLPRQTYVNLKPEFSFEEDYDAERVKAKVRLPSCLDASVRVSSGTAYWKTERAAMRDAAFQAYKQLYEAGLLNEHLLPFPRTTHVEQDYEPETFTGLLEVSCQFKPWGELADAWSTGIGYQTNVTMHETLSNDTDLRMTLTLPLPLPPVPDLELHWTNGTIFTLHFSTTQGAHEIDSKFVQVSREITHTLAQVGHSDRHKETSRDYIAVFSPRGLEGALEDWHRENCGRVSAVQHYQDCLRPRGFVRPASLYGQPHVFDKWQIDETVELVCTPLAKRRNFVQKTPMPATSHNKQLIIEAEDCTIDLLPAEYARFGLFIPAILQHLERTWVATKLSETVLVDVGIRDIRHVATAITSPSACWTSDYEQLEFIGDTVLKFIVTLQLFCEKPNWHEGYLSIERAHFVCNTRLTRAALKHGLDSFIISEPFKSRKWHPFFVSDLESETSTPRTLPAKLLADIVEALIGAAYVDGGIDRSMKCLHVFLPDIGVSAPRFPGLDHRPRNEHLSFPQEAELHIGRQFLQKATLHEALTHPSCQLELHTNSYQRLEYLGDAVLDMLVVEHFCARRGEETLSAGQMTLIKAALVNEQYLGYLCLAFTVNEQTFDIQKGIAEEYVSKRCDQQRHLWQLMRSSSFDIGNAQLAAQSRFERLSPAIEASLNQSNAHPWLELSRLDPEKFYSDLIESIIGAIFVDSDGSMRECHQFMDRIGFFTYMDRIMEGVVDVTHPRNALAKLANAEEVHYDIQQQMNDEEEIRYSCQVQVASRDVATVCDCRTKDEALISGALEARRALQRED